MSLTKKSLSLIVLAGVFYLSGCKTEPATDVSSGAERLTVERLYGSPELTGERPGGLKISPDGKRVTFLKGKVKDHRVLDLWQFNLQTGEETLLVDSDELLGGAIEVLSDEEKARRERKRIYNRGIIEYQWSEQGNRILFPINGDIYLYDLTATQPVTRLTETETFEIDPRFSPKGNYISFVRDHNVFMIRLADKVEQQVTFFGTEEQPAGVAEFVAQEEMRRYRGYWWSPDERYLAVTQNDNRPVGMIERFELYADKVSLVEQKYPKAGEDNALVRLAIIAIDELNPPSARAELKQDSALEWIPIEADDYYLPQVEWLPDEDAPTLAYSIQTRDQKQLDVWTFQMGGKQPQRLLRERDAAWLNIRHDFLFLQDSPQLLWVSEKSGHNHIYLYDRQGNEVRAVTAGAWDVIEITAVDEEKGVVYFTATLESPLEQHLYEVNFEEGGSPRKVSVKAGVHRITMNRRQPRFYIDDYSSVEQPFQVSLHKLTGEHDFYIKRNAVEKGHPLAPYQANLSSWEYGDLQLKSGERLYYKLLKPKDFDAGKKYPLIQFVYGGPGPQLVRRHWGNLYHQLLAQRGFIVLVADNRGTPNRGRDFERQYYRKFGALEVADQAGVLQRVSDKFSYIDRNRVGVYGHSYGGYLTLMLMMQKPALYQVGVAGAPVVDWKLYDTHYTERYLGKPQDNPDIYRSANVTRYVDNLQGRLLVVHGMADDNVLYNHSLQLYQALQQKGKLFDLMAYPGAKHGIRGRREWQVHYANTILTYFSDHLMNQGT